jgi:hypothetical protein
MELLKRHILLWIVFVWTGLNLSAQEPMKDDTKDSVCVSVLTCTAGKDLYAKFGHTALRVQNVTRGADVVFNYGCFDYNADNFVMKFVLGETDYLLGAEPFDYFIERYGRMGIGVTEQVLNLTQTEANDLFRLLIENLQPENQEYRYKWLYDNCTERARDMVEKAVEGKVAYEKAPTDVTVRQLLRQCLTDSPWTSFGIDMILGAEIDRKVDKRVQMFLPDVFRAEADEAHIINNKGESTPYVRSKAVILKETNEADTPHLLTSPQFVFSLLLLAVALLGWWENIKKRYCLWMDVLLHTAQGLAGILVSFLFFFSEHPGVSTNWLVILFNPLSLAYAAWIIYCQRKQRKNVLAYANLAVVVGFLVTMAVCPQSFDFAMWQVVLVLLIRAVKQTEYIQKKEIR